MSLPIPAMGLGRLSALQHEGILSKIFDTTVRPMKSLDFQTLPGMIRAVLTPVLDTNVLHVSRHFTAAVTEAIESAIVSDSAILRLSIIDVFTNVTLWDENITLACVNSIDWNWFTKVSFEYPRTQALVFPKEFPAYPNTRNGHYFLAKAFVPSPRYPTMPILELFWDTFYLTINTMTPAEYEKQRKDLRPKAKDQNPCANRHLGCKCSVTKLRPIRVPTGISGSIHNFVSPNPALRQLNLFVVLALPVWESGCIGHVVHGCGPVPIEL